MLDAIKTIEKLFYAAISIEYAAADLYGKFAKIFSHEANISKFWKKMREDEIRHAGILQTVRKELSPEQLLLSPADEMWENAVKIKRFFSTDLIESIKTLEDAYMLAHEIEFSEVNATFQFLTSNLIPVDKQEEYIVDNIVEHQQKIVDFSSNYGGRLWRKSIKSKSYSTQIN